MQNESVVRWRYDKLLLALRKTFAKKGGRCDADIIEECTEADRLILDDVGSGTSVDVAESDFSVRTLLAILDDRIEAEKSTYFSSNKPVEVLQTSFDERIASRIEGSCEIVQLVGRDRRKTPPCADHGACR